MGTNFYWQLDPGESELVPHSTDLHIGKRSAAGPYCWDCDVTLCVDGNQGIHRSGRPWFDRCPRCGQKPVEVDPMTQGPAAIELGFAKPSTERPTGVRGASSFSWAEDPEHVGAICDRCADAEVVEDEYGRRYTGREFVEMLRANCPIQFTHFIGIEFS